jgi:VWFA-related protein
MFPGRYLPVFGLWAAALAQQPAQPPARHSEPPPEPPIKVQVNEVIVPVSVTDYKDRFVSNLDKSDFKIFENGKEQKIAYFNRERNQPVVVGFILDLSSASRVHWKNYQDSASELVYTLLSEDRSERYTGFLVTYSTDAELVVNTTADPSLITDRIAKAKPGGGAAMYDAIYLAITKHKMIKGEPIEPRRVLIVIGSGNDNASKRSLDQIIELAQRNLVTIYGVSTKAYGFATEGEEDLKRLAEETGGRVEYPLEGVYKDIAGFVSKTQDAGSYAIDVESGGYASEVAKAMFNAIVAISGDVTTQYILRYVPTAESAESPKRFHALKVEVNLPEAKVRYRRGYYPNPP